MAVDYIPVAVSGLRTKVTTSSQSRVPDTNVSRVMVTVKVLPSDTKETDERTTVASAEKRMYTWLGKPVNHL